MRKVVSNPVFLSTLSTAAVVGLAVIVGRKSRQEKDITTSIEADTDRKVKSLASTTNREVYDSDSDLGYC